MGASTSPSPLAFGLFISSSQHEEGSDLTANKETQPLFGRKPGLDGSVRGLLGHMLPSLARHEG